MGFGKLALEKRYQVFISSTFRDLQDERQAVLKAALELDHMPAGMELFPASDESAWELIKDVIDASDYYVLIIGGRYGSLDDAGIGYTEKEYDYAVTTKKPVIPFLCKNPGSLPREDTETDQAAWKKLEAFREKVEQAHTCVYWESVDSLKASVIVGLTTTVKKHPAIGWVRADQIPSGTTLTDILKLRDRVAELEDELKDTRTEAPKGTEGLLQGNDKFNIEGIILAWKQARYSDGVRYRAPISMTWNEIFAGIAPTLINETSDRSLRTSVQSFLGQEVLDQYRKLEEFKDKQLSNYELNDKDFDTILVQLRALGLITESNRKRSITDTATYWALTPYGDTLMVQLRALHKTPIIHQRETVTAEKAIDE